MLPAACDLEVYSPPLDGQDFLELVAAGPGLASRFLDIHGGSRLNVAR